MPRLRALNADPSIRFMTFKPYFDTTDFPFIVQRSTDWFGAGHISNRMRINSARIRGTFTSILLHPSGREELFLALISGVRRRPEGRPTGWRRSMTRGLYPSRSFTKDATSCCNPRIRRRIGRAWALKPWRAEACLLWISAEAGNRWWNTGRPDGCAKAPGISSHTPPRWRGNRITGRIWPPLPGNAAWLWEGWKRPGKLAGSV